MAGYDLTVFGIAEKLNALLAYEAVGCTVEAVAADAVLLIILVGESIHISIVGHCLVEACIEYGNLGNAGHDLLAGLDARKVCGVVKRSEVNALLDSFLDLIIYKNRAAEFFTAVSTR